MCKGLRHFDVTDDDSIDAATQGVANEIGHEVNFDIVMAVHGMTEDPQQDRELRGHWGENAHIMKFILQHENFNGFLEEFKKTVFAASKKRTRGGHDREVRCLVLCKSGRHRSVSFAAFARWCLEYEGFAVNSIHVNRRQWGHHLCTTCTACATHTMLKERLRNKCIDIWKSIE